jgi:hypothetical protein
MAFSGPADLCRPFRPARKSTVRDTDTHRSEPHGPRSPSTSSVVPSTRLYTRAFTVIVLVTEIIPASNTQFKSWTSLLYLENQV